MGEDQAVKALPQQRVLNERKRKVNERFRCCPLQITQVQGYPSIDQLVRSLYFMDTDIAKHISASLNMHEKHIFLVLRDTAPADILPVRKWDEALKAKPSKILQIISTEMRLENYARPLLMNMDRFYQEYGPVHSVVVDHLLNELRGNSKDISLSSI